MTKAVAKYGGSEFRVPPGGHFIKIDRYTGARLSPDSQGDFVVAEYFRDGEDPIFGLMFDGGFAMGSDLELFSVGESEEIRDVTTSTGGTGQVGEKATFGER